MLASRPSSIHVYLINYGSATTPAFISYVGIVVMSESTPHSLRLALTTDYVIDY